MKFEPTDIQYWIEMRSKWFDGDGCLVVDINEGSIFTIVKCWWSIKNKPLNLLVDGFKLILLVQKETVEELVRVAIELIMVIGHKLHLS